MVLLGSIASAKYVDVLTSIFGARLRFPLDFVGRGDMSRGGLMLRSVTARQELRTCRSKGRSGADRVRRSSRRSRQPRNPAVTQIRLMPLEIPSTGSATLQVQGRDVKLTNLDKPFWPELGVTKGDLIRYYADVAALLLPHIRDRAMVMKRYPHGAAGEFFFMKRAPSPRPDWIATCAIFHGSGNVIDFPVIAGSCRRCCGSSISDASISTSGTPPATTSIGRITCTSIWIRATAPHSSRSSTRHCIVHEALDALKMPAYRQDDGVEGHARLRADRARPGQKDVWTFAKALAQELAARHPQLHDVGIQGRQTPARPRARRLQPERLGPHAGLGLFRPPPPPRLRVDAHHMEGGR